MTHAAPIKTTRTSHRTRLRGQHTLFCLALLGAFFVVVFFLVPAALPAELPIFFQRLIGLANALLAMVTAMFAVREFGRSYNRFRVPYIGNVRTSAVIGGIVFLAVYAWWLSPWAPIAPLP
jgi:hypothetical protein